MSNSENFEWDENKNRENQAKHGVSFEQAQYAFADPNLIVLEDLRHSTRDLQIVDKEFLPRPDERVFREAETENITVSLDKETAAFFKNKAKELGASYQTLVRSILKEYVARQGR